MYKKSFIEAVKSLSKDYNTGAVVHLQNKQNGSRMSPKLDAYIAMSDKDNWSVVCVQVSAPAESKSETEPQIKVEGAKE